MTFFKKLARIISNKRKLDSRTGSEKNNLIDEQLACIQKKLPVPFKYGDQIMYIAPDKTSIECISISTPKIERLARLVPASASLIFDVGAHSGLFSRFAKMACPKAKVIAFEPNNELLMTLQANQLPGTQIEQCAVGGVSGELELFFAPASTQSSSALLKAVEPFLRGGGISQKTVPMVSIDMYCKNNNISKIDVLKVDVQGYEREVLAGGQNILKSLSLLLIEASFLDFDSVKLLQELQDDFEFGYVINDVYLGADIALSKYEITTRENYFLQLW
jgi:FkbM family methyltransferase